MATRYVIFRFNEQTDEWIEHGDHVEASSASSAIRKHAANLVSGGGAYVAVPARSWKPVKVTAVQTTNLKLEQP